MATWGSLLDKAGGDSKVHLENSEENLRKPTKRAFAIHKKILEPYDSEYRKGERTKSVEFLRHVFDNSKTSHKQMSKHPANKCCEFPKHGQTSINNSTTHPGLCVCVSRNSRAMAPNEVLNSSKSYVYERWGQSIIPFEEVYKDSNRDCYRCSNICL